MTKKIVFFFTLWLFTAGQNGGEKQSLLIYNKKIDFADHQELKKKSEHRS